MHNRVHGLLEAAAETRPDALALADQDGRRLSWLEMHEAALAAAAQLKAAGVRAGDRVVLVFENCAEAIAFFFGASMLDASAVAINARLTTAELDRIIAHSDPSAILFSAASSEAARAHAGHYGAQNVHGAFGAAALMPRAGASPEPVSEDGREQLALLLYTSGTTGTPKAAMLTHANLIAGAAASAEVRGIKNSDVTYLALPLSHIFGLVTMLSVTFAQSAMRMEAQFSAERLYNALQEDVTLLPAVPQMHAHLFNYARSHGKPRYDGHKLRFVSSGGAPLDPAWKREAEAFYGLPLQNGYGLTEGAAGVCATRNGIGDPDISVGLAMGECSLKLDLDAAGATPEEGIGEILVGGPQVMKGYFHDPEQTAAAFTKDGFFRTGDLGRFDDEGRLHIAGRTKELIIRSGFNVYPVEIEAALTEHPDVVVASVVGRSFEGNEEVLAFVSAATGSSVTEQELKTFLHDRLAPYKRPARIIVAKALPAAPTGKILKAKLIETFASELDVVV
ncbi:acyl--CoA ligase [Leisingera aquaemixtae]|uniref:class I adenylate-forming enzyme family protein n=1 Tax=Leisingera aquaemixtae TaxID=1396826 RepID=UPI0021A66BAE|nr:class I adenylate-forming enzyme family protein [Leisingera aquaemixtae]UWQ24316.1 acyl--CoA ligase [Leisingera aquaemixtae]